jgi:hypothetical protein
MVKEATKVCAKAKNHNSYPVRRMLVSTEYAEVLVDCEGSIKWCRRKKKQS